MNRVKQKQKNKIKIIIALTITIIIGNFFISNLASATVKISDLEFIGAASFPTGFMFKNTELGGISGITYDAKNDVYYAISDDRGDKETSRFYTLKIDLSQGKLTKNSITPLAVTNILNQKKQKIKPGESDTEGIALTEKSTVFISSEGDRQQAINPFIQEFSLTSGKTISSLPIPDKFLPSIKTPQGIRNNLGFESLTISPNHKLLFTATENALIQDGKPATPGSGTRCRILQYNLVNQQPEKEFLYPTEPVTPLFNFTGRFHSGLPELIALDNYGNLLSLERSFTGLGFAVSIFQISLANADNIQDIDSLASIDIQNIQPVTKQKLLDLQTLDLAIDNIEGFTLGQQLPDGKNSLILVSDNNFNQLQSTQILAFSLKVELPVTPLMRLLRLLRLSPFQ